MNKKEHLYISVDVEADGPIPGPYSMLSIGAAAFNPLASFDKPVSTFYVNLLPLPGASEHPSTKEFWKKNQAAWAETQVDKQMPLVAMQRFVNWVNAFNMYTTFVSSPAGFDFTFIYWYLMYFIGSSPFSFRALDIFSYAAGMLKTPYRETYKRTFPAEWFNGAPPHDHNALNDAIGQGILFMRMLQANKSIEKENLA